MARRIDVELTSDRGDGTLTWRAAGAREPRGVLDAKLLPKGVTVGDTVKADADYDMEGVTIVAVLPPLAAKSGPERIEVIGSPPPPPRDYSKEPERRERKPRKGRDGRDGRGRGPGPGGRDGDRPPRERSERPRFERPEKPKLPPKPKAPRLRAGRANRQALLAELPEEQRPVAEQVLKGGIPAVRAAIDEQNAAAKEAGNPPVKTEALLAMAEGIVPKARVAEWLDRAEAAIEQIDTVDLRDLRSVVTKAESAAKDETSRALAEQLRTGLAARLEKEQAAWLAEIAELLADDRVVRALNVSSRPPKAGTPLPRDLAERLATAAGAALTDQIGAKRWSTVLEALALSPIHAQVEPASIPATPNEELVAAVTKVSMQVPQIAARFGIEPKPAPRSRGGRSRPRSGAPKTGAKPTGTAPAGAPRGAPRIPPPPSLADTPMGATATPAAKPAGPGHEAAPTAEEPAAAESTEAAAAAEPEVVAETVEAGPAAEESVAQPEPVAPGATDGTEGADAPESAAQPEVVAEVVEAEPAAEAAAPQPAVVADVVEGQPEVVAETAPEMIAEAVEAEQTP